MDKRKEDFEKIKEFIKNYPVGKSGYHGGLENEFFYNDISEIDYELENGDLLKDYELVHQHGGEGEGDQYFTVYYFPNANLHISFYGWYTSYNGADYSDMYLVEPKEVMITEYHNVK